MEKKTWAYTQIEQRELSRSMHLDVTDFICGEELADWKMQIMGKEIEGMGEWMTGSTPWEYYVKPAPLTCLSQLRYADQLKLGLSFGILRIRVSDCMSNLIRILWVLGELRFLWYLQIWVLTKWWVRLCTWRTRRYKWWGKYPEWMAGSWVTVSFGNNTWMPTSPCCWQVSWIHGEPVRTGC